MSLNIIQIIFSSPWTYMVLGIGLFIAMWRSAAPFELHYSENDKNIPPKAYEEYERIYKKEYARAQRKALKKKAKEERRSGV